MRQGVGGFGSFFHSSAPLVKMTFHSLAGLGSLAGMLMLCFIVGLEASIQRIEIDLLRLMDGNFAPTTLSTTITLNNGTALADIAGDEESSQLDTVYIMLANASKYIIEVQLDKAGTSKLSTYWAPHNILDTENGDVKFFMNSNTTWLANATIQLPPIGGDLKYAMAARLSNGDPELCSSYLCTYRLQNAAIGMPDRQVLDKYKNVNGGR